MASAHVAGCVAYLLGLDSTLTPEQVSFTLLYQSHKGILTNLRKFTDLPHLSISHETDHPPNSFRIYQFLALQWELEMPCFWRSLDDGLRRGLSHSIYFVYLLVF